MTRMSEEGSLVHRLQQQQQPPTSASTKAGGVTNKDSLAVLGDNPYLLQHQHRGSTSTSTTESVESLECSPTTTISTADSSSITDPSPSSSFPESPESPVEIVRLSSFSSQNTGVHSPEELSMNPPPSPLPSWKVPPLSPNKRSRNTKNLALTMMPPPPSRQAPPPPILRTASAFEPSHPNSAPPSPSFVLPPKPPKRRASKLGLTIQTPGPAASFSSKGPKGLSIVPPTPANRPHLLRHHQSSPSLSLFSPSVGGPDGGMQLPPLPNQQSTLFHRPRHPGDLKQQIAAEPASAISEHSSPNSSQGLPQLEEEEDYDVPLSQEVKSPAYTAGPVCIYDPHVFLYLEPNDEEASKFDVIFNVAREVKNPFVVAKERREKEALSRTVEMPNVGFSSREDIMTPDTAASVMTFATAFETLPTPTTASTASPTTPKASVGMIPAAKEPEYIHIPWDHNTNIVDDLLTLVEVIDDRVRQGKRVLVHCQCGVSRSASLIVAYGLFKNPSLTVQEAYDVVKRRSRWIGPNMSLIYQLSEFRSRLHKKLGVQQPGFRSWRSGGGMMGLMGNGRANTITSSSPTSRPSLALDTYKDVRPEPQTAPLPDDRDRTPVRSSPNGEGPLSAMPALHAGNSFGMMPVVPQSAPPGWHGETAFLPSPQTATAENLPFGNFAAQPREDLKQNTFVPLTLPPKPTRDTPAPPSAPAPVLDNIVHREITLPAPAPEEEPSTPSLMSPRTEFMANPFHSSLGPTAPRPGAGPSTFSFLSGALASPTTVDRDPRSPAQRGEAPIVRSIFEVL